MSIPTRQAVVVGEAPIEVHSLDSHTPDGIDDYGLEMGHNSGSTGCSGEFSVRSGMSSGVRSSVGSHPRGSSLRSGSSSDPSTPYLQSGDHYFCKSGAPRLGLMPELLSRDGKGVIDALSYSNFTIFLHEDGRVTRESSDGKSRIRSNIKARRLEKHAGYLYAVAAGILYRLNNATLNSTSRWSWTSCPWSPAGILHTSSTLDGKYLWVQDSEVGHLYDSNLRVVDKIQMGDLRRRYGQSLSDYLDYDPRTCVATVVQGGKASEYDGICAGLLTQYGQLVALGRDDLERCSDVRLVNWIPYFIGGGSSLSEVVGEA